MLESEVEFTSDICVQPSNSTNMANGKYSIIFQDLEWSGYVGKIDGFEFYILTTVREYKFSSYVTYDFAANQWSGHDFTLSGIEGQVLDVWVKLLGFYHKKAWECQMILTIPQNKTITIFKNIYKNLISGNIILRDMYSVNIWNATSNGNYKPYDSFGSIVTDLNTGAHTNNVEPDTIICDIRDRCNKPSNSEGLCIRENNNNGIFSKPFYFLANLNTNNNHYLSKFKLKIQGKVSISHRHLIGN
jgi:hypothetical protein